MAFGNELLQLGKEDILPLVVADYACRVDIPRGLFQDIELRMVLLLDTIADLLDQVGIDLA